ncbi:hypothetical protein [uncultured Lactobacillus sp.]|uniref:hypothetical protein n=1 Tax=uncultured Lactobacillus sp. TaxID=153152 RepID=UPI00261D5D23|nr:hypothetical protein [uncultured Lactobacillus sp.]
MNKEPQKWYGFTEDKVFGWVMADKSFCNFDYPGKNRVRYSYHEYEDQDKTLRLPTGASKFIINAKGKLAKNSEDLQNLARLIQGEPIKDNNVFFNYAQEKIREINLDKEKRLQIMDYETKLLEREQYGELKGRKIGLKMGELKGRKAGLKIGAERAAADNIRKTIVRYRKFNISEDQILESLIADYSQYFTPQEIRRFMAEGRN